MPVNLGALGTPQPDESAAPAEEQDKPKRRSKAQMIADAVVPGIDEVVTIKDVPSNSKVERPWRVAVEMVRDGKAEWPDNTLKYAFQKYEQQRAQGAFASDGPSSQGTTGAADTGDPSTQTPSPEHQESGKKGDENIPPEAEVGDEIVIGSETYRLGHGRVLTHGTIGNPDGSIINAKRRWQRELGSGPSGAWESAPVSLSDRIENVLMEGLAESATNTPVSNGNGAATQTERQPADVEQVDLLTWRVGTGILNKIGLPDYSQLQIGPINVSHMVLDDGRRTTVVLGDRTAQIPTAVIEGFQQACDVCEYVARYQRGQLISFLESVGALKQPVSS